MVEKRGVHPHCAWCLSQVLYPAQTEQMSHNLPETPSQTEVDLSKSAVLANRKTRDIKNRGILLVGHERK